MNVDHSQLKQKARNVYERARLCKALKVMWFIVPLASCYAILSPTPLLCASIGTGLVLLSVYFGWRGMELEQAIMPGLLTGTIAGIPPLFTSCCLSEHTLRSSYMSCMLPCLLSGILAGSFLAWWVQTHEAPSRTIWLAGGLLASLTASLGCLSLGFTGALVVLITMPMATTATSWVLTKSM